MDDMIRFEVRGTVKAALRFKEFPDQLRDELLKEMNALGREAFELVAAAVPHRTGRLASEEQLLIVNEPNVVGAVVNFEGDGADQNDFKKAGALEYGSSGKRQQVKEHAFMLDHVFDRMLAAPEIAIVEAYERTPNLAPDFFVRGPMAAMQGNIFERLEAVVTRAADAANQE
ncbi:hypothetical protein [Novosphingobium sp. FSW06-99]|uniref:hypothetical protein n=1 Tax=Novosphingobium sp. FSW06-99 TaxID=1739113 RepID=UPI00076CE920|nr:hypothetical protein [Novosphingobium sp. FSW06-99]KUR73860.1 hypothetical protein AQZ49_19870 [Novosphingobium sp. FSW06-99]